MRLCVVVIAGFLAGGALAAGMFRWLGYRTLFLPAGFTGVAALACGGEPPGFSAVPGRRF